MRRHLNRARARRADSGVSSLELVLYAPLLMLFVFLAVQFSLYYLGVQAVQSVAREAARVVRTGGDPQAGTAAAINYANQVGHGIISNTSVRYSVPAQGQVRAEVSADVLSLVPISGIQKVSAAAQGPIEAFRTDN